MSESANMSSKPRTVGTVSSPVFLLLSTLEFSDMVFKGYSRKLIAILKFYVAEEATPILMWDSKLSLLPGHRRKGQQQN